MGLFTGKKGVILGVANDHSIAWAIARFIMAEGGECGFTHLPDRPDDERQRNLRLLADFDNYRRRVELGLPGDSHGDWIEAERQLGVAK